MSRKLVVIDLPIDRAYVRGIFSGIAAFARTRADWELFQAVRTGGPGTDFADVFRSHRPDGLIWNMPSDKEYRLRKKFCPHIVDVSGRLQHTAVPRVIPDNVAVGRLAAGHLRDTGIRHMAFVGYRGFWYSELRLAGFAAFCREAGLPLAAFDKAPPFASYTQTDASIQKFLAKVPRPAAVFAANDNLALRVIQACRNAGWRVPDEVAVMGCDNDELAAALSNPPLTSIELPSHKLGFAAAETLDRMMRGEAVTAAEPMTLAPVGVVRRVSTDVMTVPDESVVDALRYIAGHAHESLRVGHLLDHLMLSRRSLEMKFRKYLGKTPAEAIRQAQLERAKELLHATDRSIPAVARECGFVNTKHFARSFRMQVGTSPSAYRSTFRRA